MQDHAHGHPYGHGTGATPWEAWAALAFVVLLAGGYLLLARRARRRNAARGWTRWRTASFLSGCVLLGAALLPPVATFAHDDFRGHMTQHLLLGMYAPLGLVLGAPVTLALRTLPAPRARSLTRLLHAWPVRALAHPLPALLLSVGSLAVLYFTPLYGVTSGHPSLHWVLHAHFLFSGCLFAHAVAGPDPAPSRPAVPVRLLAVGVAVAAHATISQLMYGGFFIEVHAPVDQVRGGAEIMYYGGDIAELLLAGALVATWRPSRRSGVGAAHPVLVQSPDRALHAVAGDDHDRGPAAPPLGAGAFTRGWPLSRRGRRARGCGAPAPVRGARRA
ncbi:cytochrome c oxidase assembly protein [Streptomyces sp. NPDC005892]|uniref:cytochrome c oxidase assembly protein n=1 Tax=Streptomyces sp. NPDC005892 TaxID=3155593 RepID=UPI0033E078A3